MGATSAAISFTLGAALSSSYNNAFSSAKSKANELGSAFGKVNKQLSAVSEYRASTKALEKIKQLQQNSTVSSDKLAKAYDIVSDKVTKSTKNLGKYNISLNDIGKTQEELRKKSEKLALQLESQNRIKGGISQIKSGWVGATAAAATIAIPVKAAANFEQSMANVRAVTNATDEDFAKLGDTAKTLGKNSIFGANEAAKGMETLARQGFKTNQIISAMPSVLDLAAAVELDVAAAANTASDVIKAFRMDFEDTGKVTDMLAKSLNLSTIKTTELGNVLKNVGPAAKASGVSLEDITSFIIKLNDAGIDATKAGFSLRKMLSSISSPASSGAEAFDELGIETMDAAGNMRPLFEILQDLDAATKDLGEGEKAEVLDKIFGSEFIGKADAVLKDVGKMKDLSGVLRDSAGEAKKLAEIRTRTFQGQLKILSSAFSDIGITIGSVFLPPLTAVIKTIAIGTSWIGNLAQKFPTLTSIVVIGATAWLGYAKILPVVGGGLKIVTGVLMPMLPFLKTLFPIILTGIRAIGVAIMSNPIGAIITALIIGATLLIKYWEPVSEFFVSIWEKIISIGDAWKEVKSWFGFGDEETPTVGGAIANTKEDVNTEAPKGGLWNSWFGGEEEDQNIEAKNKAIETIEQSSVSNKKTIQDNRRSDYKINIQTQPGQDSKEIANAVMKELENREQKKTRGALYDYSNA